MNASVLDLAIVWRVLKMVRDGTQRCIVLPTSCCLQRARARYRRTLLVFVMAIAAPIAVVPGTSLSSLSSRPLTS